MNINDRIQAKQLEIDNLQSTKEMIYIKTWDNLHGLIDISEYMTDQEKDRLNRLEGVIFKTALELVRLKEQAKEAKKVIKPYTEISAVQDISRFK